MANSAVVSLQPFATSPAASSSERILELASLDLHRPARVVAIALEAELAAWVRAVGISEGEQVVVLRRAAFGGPLHVRTRAGGEFALHRSLARAIRLQPMQ